MASNRGPNDDDSERKRTEDNPFISFRRFADEQVSGLLNLSMKIMGVPDTHTVRTGDAENRTRAYQNRDQRNGYTDTEDGGQEGGDGRGRADTLEEEIDRLDREMMAWLNGAEWHERRVVDDVEGHQGREEHSRPWAAQSSPLRELKERHKKLLMEARQEQDDMAQDPYGQAPVHPSCSRGPWHFRFGSCRREKERSQDDKEMENWQNDSNRKAGSEWRDFTQRIGTEKNAPKVHTWHWSWSYPPRASEETDKDTRAPAASSNTAAQEPALNSVGDGLWDLWENGLRRNFPTSSPFPALGYGLGFVTHMANFLTLNDYSPLQLESSMLDSDIAWREAFEDLLRAETGQPLLSQKELRETEQISRGVWTHQLVSRTLLNSHMSERGRRPFWAWPSTGEPLFSQDLERRIPPNRWLSELGAAADADEHDSYEYGHDHEDQHDDPPTPRPDTASSTFARISEADEEDGPETELEAYEHLLGPTPFTPSNYEQESTASRPSILSTLTTTERTTHPDGTVTTKMALKKRFADGREERSETVHTTQGRNKHVESELPSEMGVQQQIKQQETPPKQGAEKKSKGWFWS